MKNLMGLQKQFCRDVMIFDLMILADEIVMLTKHFPKMNVTVQVEFLMGAPKKLRRLAVRTSVPSNINVNSSR